MADPILLPDDFGTSSLEKFSPVLARMSAIMKYNKQLNLKCTKGPLGEDFMKWLEEVGPLLFTDNKCLLGLNTIHYHLKYYYIY